MLKLNIEKFMGMIGAARNKRFTIAELAEATDIHRNILSRMINRPTESSSTKYLDKLIQFFWMELRPITNEKISNEDLMRGIVADLISVGFDVQYMDRLAHNRKLNESSLKTDFSLPPAVISLGPVTKRRGPKKRKK